MAKVNMSLTRNAMPTQAAAVRAHNFDEVALGYREEQALDEANRCLNCKNMPCVDGCPVKIHIPEFISKIKEGDFEGAYQIITKSSSLPAVCGRVCPQETQCESKCVRGIKGESVGIGRLERFVADWHNTFWTEDPVKPESNGHKVAIIGSGPSGLTCAGDLAKKGYPYSSEEEKEDKSSTAYVVFKLDDANTEEVFNNYSWDIKNLELKTGNQSAVPQYMSLAELVKRRNR